MLECSFSFFFVFGDEGRQGGSEGEYPRIGSYFSLIFSVTRFQSLI
jgi:hypothetical protein